MPISAVHHVAVTVKDLDRSIAFYQDILGYRAVLDFLVQGSHMERLLRLRPDTTARSVVLQQGEQTLGSIELMQCDPTADKQTAAKRPGDPGMFLLSFEVQEEELEAVYQRLRERGVRFYSEPQEVNVGGLGTARAVVFEDPDGTMIELIQLPSPEDIRKARAAKREQEVQSEV